MSGERTEGPMSILVVDDESMIAMFLEDMLVDLGCEVLGPASAVACRDGARSKPRAMRWTAPCWT